MMGSGVKRFAFFLGVFLLAGSARAAAASMESPMKVNVKIILKKLSLVKQEKMQDFQEKVYKYINNYEWFEPKDLPPFELNLQMVLEDLPSNVEDRYRASVLAAGPDIQYFDKRVAFPFQKGEPLEHDGQFTPLKGIIDFYVYLIIANEYDKMGYLEGQPFFEKAKQVLEQGKFSRYFTGWDRREELLKKIFGDNYKKFREMKDYYFYGMSIVDEDEAKARQYVAQAVNMLEEVLLNDSDLEAAKQFIDAHFQEILDLFKDQEDKTPIEVLQRIDPDRKEVYDRFLQ